MSAPLKAINPRSPISGALLAVDGRVTGAGAGAGAGAVAISTSSPVGWATLTGAAFKATTAGSLTGLMGSTTSTGRSTIKNGTGELLDFARVMALAFG